MHQHFRGYLILALAGLLYLLGGACIVATLHALTVRTTLAAVESAFGTGVLALLFLLLARTTWRAGKSRTKSEI